MHLSLHRQVRNASAWICAKANGKPKRWGCPGPTGWCATGDFPERFQGTPVGAQGFPAFLVAVNWWNTQVYTNQ